MSRSFHFVLFALAAFTAMPLSPSDVADPTAQAAEATTELAPFLKQLADAKEIAASLNQTEKSWAEANRFFLDALVDPRFNKLSEVQQAEAFSGAGWAAIRLRDYSRALKLFGQATTRGSENSEDWLMSARLEEELGQTDAAAGTLVTALRKWPELLQESENDIFQAVNNGEAGSQSRLALMQLLLERDWHPKDPRMQPWYKLALERIRLGDREAARVALGRITSPGLLVKLRSDKRFDGLFDPDAPQFDPVAAANRQMDALRVQAILNPDKLQVMGQLTRAMLAIGMNDAVLELSDRIMRAADAKSSDAAFVDMDQLVWVMSHRSTALMNLGHTDEAIALMEKAAGRDFNGQRNVNQMLDLGNLYCGLGRADDALSAAAKAGEMSGYGRTVQAWVQHCGAVLKGDQQGAAKAMTYLHEHRAEGPALFMRALLRTNQLDQAAKTIIERLASEDTRTEMLFDVQDFLEPKPLPGNVKLDANWQAILARDDVKQAIEKVGRTQHYDYYGD